jgi:hypothetical protein
MGKVLYFKRKPSTSLKILDGVVVADDRPKDIDYDPERLEEIRKSLEKINNLMSETKRRVTDEEFYD